MKLSLIPSIYNLCFANLPAICKASVVFSKDPKPYVDSLLKENTSENSKLKKLLEFNSISMRRNFIRKFIFYSYTFESILSGEIDLYFINRNIKIPNNRIPK